MPGKLLDTTVLIDLSRGQIAAADFLDSAREAGTPLFVSIVSAMESLQLMSDNDHHFEMISGLIVARPY